MSKNNLGDIGVSYLLHLLDLYSSRLDYLNLCQTKMGKQSIELLGNILQKNHMRLRSLNIGGNQLGDTLFSEICLGISKNLYLEKLFSSDNNLGILNLIPGKISSIILSSVLRYDKKLKVLDISKNCIDDSVINNIFKGLISNTILEVLVLNENHLTNKSLGVKLEC